jgi:hypothetical protein
MIINKVKGQLHGLLEGIPFTFDAADANKGYHGSVAELATMCIYVANANQAEHPDPSSPNQFEWIIQESGFWQINTRGLYTPSDKSVEIKQIELAVVRDRQPPTRVLTAAHAVSIDLAYLPNATTKTPTQEKMLRPNDAWQESRINNLCNAIGSSIYDFNKQRVTREMS